MSHKHSSAQHPVKLIGVAAMAAAIGAAVAMVFTPRTGNQVRGGVKRRATNFKKDINSRFEKEIDEVGDTATDVKERLQETATKVVAETKASKTQAKDAVDKAKIAKPRSTRVRSSSTTDDETTKS